MPTISIVTPFLNGLDLLADYDAATQGAEVIIVDNGSEEETRTALATLPKERGKVLRNNSNLGFAAANNQGYAAATGDIVIFLNSDIAADPAWLKMVVDDVKEGSLYGPSLAHQLVAGRWLPYIEGWCIAATRATWDRLWCIGGENKTLPPLPCGPWDSDTYPGPYWEDNDLCFRAMQQGFSLIQTTWPITHKGGRTAGALLNHAESLEANRATFTRRVMAGLPSVEGTPTHQRYMELVHTQSDIQHHLPLLYSLARGNVVELGTRGGVSTTALLAGVEAHGGLVWSVDIDPACAKVAEGHPQWTFIQGDSRDPELPGRLSVSRFPDPVVGIDLLFIDTEHAYEITQAELKLWYPYLKPGSTILLHDPETFPGVRRAVEEFCEAKGWPVTFVLPCHGMAVIDVSIAKDMTSNMLVSTEGAAWAAEYDGVAMKSVA